MSELFHKGELAEKIRIVLLRDWDPVGIGDNPNLRDEYDSYIPELVRILSAPSVNREAILAYLLEIETDRMGLPEDPERIAIAASNLVGIVSGALIKGVH
jgi:hypothetical protein